MLNPIRTKTKAFDKVPHVHHISKVKAHGITGVVADWIEEWHKNVQKCLDKAEDRLKLGWAEIGQKH